MPRPLRRRSGGEDCHGGRPLNRGVSARTTNRPVQSFRRGVWRPIPGPRRRRAHALRRGGLDEQGNEDQRGADRLEPRPTASSSGKRSRPRRRRGGAAAEGSPELDGQDVGAEFWIRAVTHRDVANRQVDEIVCVGGHVRRGVEKCERAGAAAVRVGADVDDATAPGGEGSGLVGDDHFHLGHRRVRHTDRRRDGRQVGSGRPGFSWVSGAGSGCAGCGRCAGCGTAPTRWADQSRARSPSSRTSHTRFPVSLAPRSTT